MQIRVRIPVHVMNAEQAPGVKRGGTVNIVTHTVEVVCAPENIPELIDVDISGLEINYSKHLNEVELPSNVRVVGKLDQTLVTIVPPSGYAEEMKAAAEAAAACGAPLPPLPPLLPPKARLPGGAPGAAAPGCRLLRPRRRSKVSRLSSPAQAGDP